MPISIPGVPFKLTPQDMGQPDLIASLLQGQKLGQNFQMFPQQLQAAKLQNQWNPQLWQSQIGLQGNEGQALAAEAALNRFRQANPQYLDLAAALYSAQKNRANPNMQANGGNAQDSNPYSSGNNQGGANSFNQPPSQDQSQPAASSSMDNSQSTGSDQSGSGIGQYGLSMPSLSIGATNPIYAKALGVPPLDTIKMQTYAAQVQDQYNRYAHESDQANKAAIAANNFKQSLSVFNNAMDNTDLSGSVGGLAPAITTNSQIADIASAKALPESVDTMRQAMGSARFSNLDMQQADKLNFTRSMNKGTRNLYTNWSNAVSDRMMEYPQLVNWAKNPNNHVRLEDTQRAWQLYQEQNPIISKDGKSVNAAPKYPLADYITPQALASIRQTGTYDPSKKYSSSIPYNSKAVADKFVSPSKTLVKNGVSTKYIKGQDGEWYY